MKTTKVNFLEKEEFNQFYSRLVDVVMDAKDNPNAGVISIEDLMKEVDLTIDVEPKLKSKVSNALSANLYAPSQVAMDECAACSICAVCAVCGTINGAAGVLGLAGLVTFVSAKALNSNAA